MTPFAFQYIDKMMQEKMNADDLIRSVMEIQPDVVGCCGHRSADKLTPSSLEPSH